MVRKVDELEQALAEKDKAYQHLMAQAVRFATYLQEIMDTSDVGGMGMYEQVQAFLKEHHDTRA